MFVREGRAHRGDMKAVLLALVCAAPLASADPIIPQHDNLYVDVHCADYWANPDRGLNVRVDGAAQDARGVESTPVLRASKHGAYTEWVPTDISFLVAPGTHEIAIDAPGCASSVQQIVFAPYAPVFVSGRLPVTDDTLRGTTGAPNGFGVLLGAYNQARGPRASSNDIEPTRFAYDGNAATGGWLSMTFEHRGTAMAFDMLYGGGSISGTAMGTDGVPYRFSGGTFQIGYALRIGKRLAFDHIALAAGAGIGGSLWINHGNVDGNEFLANPNDADPDWYVPLWSALTYKPDCNWGLQVLAQYQVHPGSTNEDAPTIAGGLLWQPSAACAERAGIAVRG
jgi:hypothetical protein